MKKCHDLTCISIHAKSSLNSNIIKPLQSHFSFNIPQKKTLHAVKSNRWNTRSYRTSIEVFNQSVGREVICVLTFNKGNKVWFQQTINADIEYSETLKHVVTDITPGVSSTQRTQCGDCVFPLVIRNVTKVLSNTVKQGYTRGYRVSVYHKHPQLSYFSLERKNKEKKPSFRVSFWIQQFTV